MKKIKFRAWNPKMKKMLWVQTLNWFHPIERPSAGVVSIFCTKIDTKQCTREMNIPGGNTILMQYTGFSDKNGKEIYEGDIIEWRRYYRPALYGKRVVEISSHGLADIERWYKDIEVVGNIYENPKLCRK